MLGENPTAAQPQRVAKMRPAVTQPQRVENAEPRTAAPATKTWYLLGRNAIAFLATKAGGLLWSKVSRCVTLSLSTHNVVEDLQVNKSMPEKLLRRLLPAGTAGACTILYHIDDNVTDMPVPAIQPQRVAPTRSADSKGEDYAPNYISDDDGDERPARHRRSPRLNKVLEEERPDRRDNVLHRIVALVAAETAEVPRLVIQQEKLTRGYGAANLELQLKKWGYDTHSNWAEANNLAGAIVCQATGNMLEYRDLIKIPELQ